MKILLVKLSSLGDVVHTLPVVQDILAARPGAQIDWVVEKSFAPLLAPLLASGHVQRVISCELRRWRKAPLAAATRAEWGAFKKQLQAQPYDAVIDLQGLTKSAVVARLARLTPGGKRYALANQTEGSAYEAPTRWVADVAIALPPHIHAMQRGRELCARALGYTLSPVPDFGLKVPPALMEHAQAAPETIAFVHGTSRPDKQWPLENWVTLGRQLIAQGYRIALPHGSTDELATSQAIAAALNVDDELGGSLASRGRGTGFAGSQAQRPLGGQGSTRSDERGGAIVWPRLALDALTQHLAQCAGVIGVDSGLSHIAVALDLPHVQIYNFDTAWRTGPLPDSARPAGAGAARQLSVFAQPTPSVQAVWDAWLSCLPLPAQVSEWAALP
ncbi:lipopolysaccharide heptosyltransferase I [Polaromonas sp.]|uniref:lipopolysaccharide heptosyltransferase I n=1 Tax=Polaromonas sp. TaxID=1869339 RepID=UPI00248818B3|nr:lipopolysaccharide heptosyltransferase I [Polaromonas sp.]MDI1339304.1 lipopolysaccharide heptosyltransferase I [Polaromonas sp.]